MPTGADPGAVRNFKAVEHRLEFVIKIAGVDYYNDSKATNVDATIKRWNLFRRIFIYFGARIRQRLHGAERIAAAAVKRVYTIGRRRRRSKGRFRGGRNRARGNAGERGAARE